jgi:DNA-directed RNA polymerase specialized sigma subunit
MEYNGIEKDILDELSDGQWHPLYKIKKEVNTRMVKPGRDFKSKINKGLDSLLKDNIIISGANESYRLVNPHLEKWRKVSDDPNLNDKNRMPRYFGGILEDDGWIKAPLKQYDMVHFRMNTVINSKEISKMLNDSNARVVVDHATQLIRVYVPEGHDVREKVLSIKSSSPDLGIHSVRLEKSLRRRDLNELPKHYVDGICQYYGKFAKVLLRPYMSSITKHIKEYDDVQQQIYLWVIEAIQRYDADTSIPFAAYLASSLKKWVFNLARESYGRSIADIELKHSRAVNEFRNENDREPTAEELMEILNSTDHGIAKDKIAIAAVNNLRNISTIHQEDGDLQIPDSYSIEKDIESRVEATTLSAALTKAALETKTPALGLIAVYYQIWGKDKTPKKISQYLNNSKHTKAKNEVLKNTERMLKEID